MKKIPFFFVIVFLLLSCNSYAAVEKEIQFKSTPSGAQVYLKTGSKETKLGKTPFVGKIKFHSEISVARIVFKKKGYEDKTIKVEAKENRVSAKLESYLTGKTPDKTKNPTLAKLYEEVMPQINGTIQEYLDSNPDTDYDINGEVRFNKRKDGQYEMVLPFVLYGAKDIMVKGKESQNGLKPIWDELGNKVVQPIAQEIKDSSKLKNIILEVTLYRQKKSMQIKANMETTTQCVPGYKTEYELRSVPITVTIVDADGRWKGTRTEFESRRVPVQKYYPCLRKKIVRKVKPKVTQTETNVKDPKAMFSLDLKKSNNFGFENIKIDVIDPSGK